MSVFMTVKIQVLGITCGRRFDPLVTGTGIIQIPITASNLQHTTLKMLDEAIINLVKSSHFGFHKALLDGTDGNFRNMRIKVMDMYAQVTGSPQTDILLDTDHALQCALQMMHARNWQGCLLVKCEMVDDDGPAAEGTQKLYARISEEASRPGQASKELSRQRSSVHRQESQASSPAPSQSTSPKHQDLQVNIPTSTVRATHEDRGLAFANPDTSKSLDRDEETASMSRMKTGNIQDLTIAESPSVGLPSTVPERDQEESECFDRTEHMEELGEGVLVEVDFYDHNYESEPDLYNASPRRRDRE